MRVKHIVVYSFLVLVFNAFSQENLYSSITIPDNLKNNANAVVREHAVNITLKSSNEMLVSTKRIITVLNKKGNDNIGAFVHYDNNKKIKELQVVVYNNFGNQIKKIKKNDFKDVSAADGISLYSDSRVKYLEYTPINYPYTIEFTCETIDSNTAFIQPFYPLEDYFLSIENSSYNIFFPPGISIRTKEKNFENLSLEKETFNGKKSFKLKNIEAVKPEVYSPSFSVTAPRVLVAANKFSLEGVNTQVENWNDFGKWMYHDLIKDTHDLSASTVSAIQNLVEGETNNLAKAKKVYQFVQDKVRYISVQVGIGGWKPFNASKVDELGYGDCKALTNYTMALLNAVGIESHYTVVYAKSSQRNIEEDFAAMQGNHVILNIPNENGEDIWLECTSQKLPFGFIGDFTDDRDVLVITPEGGKIKHTKKYKAEESLQTINGNCVISNEGAINAKVNVVSKGIQYDNKYWLDTKTDRDLDTHYKKRWGYINDLNIDKMMIDNDKEKIEFVENVDFKASNYSKIIGDRMLFPINVLNKDVDVPDRYRNRKLPLQIKRGFKDIDNVEITLPSNYKIESQPKNISVVNKYGSYKMELTAKDETTLIYHREFMIKDGVFPKEDYNDFREFYKEVSKHDNAKIALIKK